MKTPRMETVHACSMPEPKGKWAHSIYVCDCGCGWREVVNPRIVGAIVWQWEQVL